MKISSIKIHNFRSIESTELNLDNFNIFVGQNNCGKTNLFEAIDFFYNGVPRGVSNETLKFLKNEDLEMSVEIEFSGSLEGASKMKNEANRTKIISILDDSDVVVVKRVSSSPGKRKVYVSGAEVNSGTGFDAALNDFLPKFEYVSTRQYYDAVAKYGKTTPIGIMLSGVLTAILEKDPQYKDFQSKFRELFEDESSQIRVELNNMGGRVNAYLSLQFPDCVNVNFSVTVPEFDELLKNFDTSIDDGIDTLAEEKGDGMQRALMLAIIQAYADFRKADETVKSFLFFIDEAELHLHPTAQRRLKDVLYQLSQNGDQVFINTHSSVLVADDYLGQKVYKVEKNEKKTTLSEVTSYDKPHVVFELLGGSPSDLLLPRNFLLVEGASEFELISRIIKRFYIDKPSIQVIAANGDISQARKSLDAINHAFKALEVSIYRNRLVILIDKPNSQLAQSVSKFKQDNSDLITNGQFFELPVEDIEQYYPQNSDPINGIWRKTSSEARSMIGPDKLTLAKNVGDLITQHQFEIEMEGCFTALEKCWSLAFSAN